MANSSKRKLQYFFRELVRGCRNMIKEMEIERNTEKEIKKVDKQISYLPSY